MRLSGVLLRPSLLLHKKRNWNCLLTFVPTHAHVLIIFFVAIFLVKSLKLEAWSSKKRTTTDAGLDSLECCESSCKRRYAVQFRSSMCCRANARTDSILCPVRTLVSALWNASNAALSLYCINGVAWLFIFYYLLWWLELKTQGCILRITSSWHLNVISSLKMLTRKYSFTDTDRGCILCKIFGYKRPFIRLKLCFTWVTKNLLASFHIYIYSMKF